MANWKSLGKALGIIALVIVALIVLLISWDWLNKPVNIAATTNMGLILLGAVLAYVVNSFSKQLDEISSKLNHLESELDSVRERLATQIANNSEPVRFFVCARS